MLLRIPWSNGLRIAATGTVAVVVIGVAMIAWLLRDPTPRMLARRSQLANVAEGRPYAIGSHVAQEVRLTATSGLVVDLAIKRPPLDAVPHRRRLGLLIGGFETGRAAVHMLDDTRGVIVAAVSYPGADTGFFTTDALNNLPRIRRTVHDTPPALMLALDYLLARPDVDRTHVEGVGVSFGVPFICAAAALDDRITRVWAVHGSGGSYAPIELNLRPFMPSALRRRLIARAVDVSIAGPRFAAETWAPRVAPRPFIMINASDDPMTPMEWVTRLYEAANEPKELIWMPGGHVGLDIETVRPLVDVVFQRLEREDR